MPFLNRWNYETQEYDPYGVPDDWNVKSYSDDMDEIVNCPHCGKEVRDELNKRSIPFTIVLPSLDMKQEMIDRYIKRGNQENFVTVLENNYETFVNDLMSDPNNKIVLDSSQYLKDVV